MEYFWYNYEKILVYCLQAYVERIVSISLDKKFIST